MDYISIENALEYALIHLSESKDPEFSISIEEAVFVHDLTPEEEEELIKMYDKLND
jgi:homoserine acetyltransferase